MCNRVVSTLIIIFSLLVSIRCFADAANNFVLAKTNFGANEQIVLELGALTIDSGDTFVPASNVFIIPAGLPLDSSTFLPDLDPSSLPNVIQGSSGGGFFQEGIGFTGPTGTIGAGTWDIVEDHNQNNIFDSNDSVLRNAFTVTIVTDVPPIMSSSQIAAIKLRAASARGQLDEAKAILDASRVLAGGISTFLAGGIEAVLASVRDELIGRFLPCLSIGDCLSSFIGGIIPDTPVEWGFNVIDDLVADTTGHYAGIAADPPDFLFEQVTPLRARIPAFAGGNDPFDEPSAALFRAMQDEGATAEAFLHAMERYQGADARGNGDWALLHARQLREFALLLAENLNASNDAYQQFLDALNADTRDLDGTVASYQLFQSALQNNGYSLEQLQLLANLGFNSVERDALRNEILNLDLSAWSKAGLIANFNATRANNSSFIGELNALAIFLDGIIAALVADPLAADIFPVVDAGGPYLVDESAALILDASNSEPGSDASTITTYEWDLDGDGEFDDASGVSPSVQLVSTQSGVIGLKLTNDRGRMNIGYASITVNDTNPAPSIIGFTTPELQPTVISSNIQQFSVNASDNGAVSVEWFLDGVSVASGPTFNYMPSVADVGLHNLVAVVNDNTASGGAITQTWTISVKEVDGDADGFTVTGGDCNDADGAVNPAASEIIDNGIDDDCNANTEDADQPPVANFFSVPFLGVPGEPMMLNDNSTDPNGDIVSYLWDFGDGSPTSSEQNPTHTFAQAVTYEVTLTVTDSQGNTDAISLPVEIVGAIVNTRVSDPDAENQDTLGDQGDDNVGDGFDITPDGRWLVFASLAENIVPDDTNGAADIFVLDRENGKVVRVSVHTDGTEGRVVNSTTNLTQFNTQPTISPDGRYIGFLSNAENLIGEDLDDDGRCDLPATFTNGGCTGHRGEIFVRDRDTDGNGIFDEPGGVETLVASRYFQAANPIGTGAGARSLSMSNDACVFGFEATGDDFVDGVGPVGGISTPHVFMVDRCNDDIRVVSKDIFGVAIRGFFRQIGSYGHRISGDGRYLVWYSQFDDRAGRGVGGTGAGIVGEDTDNDGFCDAGCSTRGDGLNADVYLYDWVADRNQQVSINTLGQVATYNESPTSSGAVGGGAGSTLPSISNDGRFVAFFSSANNLNLDALNNVIPMPEALGNEQDVYLHDRDKDGNGIFDEPGGIETRLISMDLNGLANGQISPGPANDGTFVVGSGGGLAQRGPPQVSNDGRFVSYFGRLSRTVPGDFPQSVSGIVVYDTLAGTNSTPFFDLDGDPTDSIYFFLRHDGRFLATRTNSAEVTGIDVNGDGRCRETQGDLDCDTNGRADIYLQDRDADDDGLFSDMDGCLNTPPNAEIDEEGCALTSDLAIAISVVQSPIASGADALFDITVSNVGGASLHEITVVDELLPDCDRVFGSLLPGELENYQCSMSNTTSGFTHSATVSGVSSAGESLSANASANVEVASPSIAIEHSPDPKEVPEGSDYVLSVMVENTGPIALTNVAIDATPLDACDRNLGAIGVGDTVSYACLGSNAMAGFTSQVSASGDVNGGGNVSAQASLEVTVIPDEIEPPEPPPAPVNVVARAKSGKANVVWSHNGSLSYNVYRSANGAAFALHGNTSSTYSVFVDAGLTDGTEYCYFVRALDDQGLESADSATVCATPQARRRSRRR